MTQYFNNFVTCPQLLNERCYYYLLLSFIYQRLTEVIQDIYNIHVLNTFFTFWLV